MQNFKAIIKDPIGLHARPASLLVTAASKFSSSIVIKVRDKSGNLKSIMNVMALGVKMGDEITIEADGEDEKLALENLQNVMKVNNLI